MLKMNEFQVKAMRLVSHVADISEDDLFVVWFSKTLQNWKALVASHGDTRYFEVTHNGDKGETYVDTYFKRDNKAITDAEYAYLVVHKEEDADEKNLYQR